MHSFFGKGINKHIVYVLPCILLIAAFSAGAYYLGSLNERQKYSNFMASFKTIRESSDKYVFTSPLIGGLTAPATDVGIFSDIHNDIFNYLKSESDVGNLYGYSFYFRDFGSGLWYGLNESATFFPASLFKLPIAIAVYKQIEADPSFLKKQVIYSESLSNKNLSNTGNSDSILIVNKSYSIEELVQVMLKESDNGAKNLLLESMDINYLNKLFEIVALVEPNAVKTYEISSSKYGYFLRILYGSSYLNEDHSELILSYLAKSTFKDAMVAGLPAVVQVAHKFGAYDFEEVRDGKKVTVQQLHDCGVVYHANRPYLFCFMTKGKDVKSLERIIAHVSKMVYDHQDQDEEFNRDH